MPASAATGAWLASECQPGRRGGSELRTRVISAAVLAPVALAATALGGLTFALLVAVMAVIAFWEWGEVTAVRQPGWLRTGSAICLSVGLVALSLLPALWGVGVIALAALAAFAVALRKPRAVWTGIGILYVAAPCAALIVLRAAEPFGWAAILFILVVVWATDIAAYFGGRAIGGPKIWTRVSPKKTWSGGISGVIAAMLLGGLTVWATGAASILAGLLLAALLSIASQIGDFAESAVKRRFGAKDSGRIIPGHGGLLDRVDGLFAAAVLACLIAALGLGGALLTLPGEPAPRPEFPA